MFDTLEALDKVRHSGLHFRGVEGHAFARHVSWAPLACSEMVKASRDIPIMFASGDRVRPVALMAMRGGQNAFVGPGGEWQGRYVPAHLRRYPFVLGETGKDDRFVVMIDRAAPNFIDSREASVEEGDEAMFRDGAPAENGIIQRAQTFLLEFQRELQQSERLLAPLKERDVLVERQLTLTREGKQEVAVNGFAMVDVERLKALDDATLAEWARSGLLGLVYAHLQSQGNTQRLLKGISDVQRAA